jgi:hypothetical protein
MRGRGHEMNAREAEGDPDLSGVPDPYANRFPGCLFSYSWFFYSRAYEVKH